MKSFTIHLYKRRTKKECLRKQAVSENNKYSEYILLKEVLGSSEREVAGNNKEKVLCFWINKKTINKNIMIDYNVTTSAEINSSSSTIIKHFWITKIWTKYIQEKKKE